MWANASYPNTWRLLYTYLSKLYKAAKIGTYQIGEIVFSQMLAIGMADAILYIECCLIARAYVNIVPGLITALLQLAGMTVWAVLAKRYFIKHIESSKTLVVYGKDDVDEFTQKLNRKYTHLFKIEERIPSDMPIEELFRKIDQYDTVMLYEIASGVRTETMKYCIENHKKFYMTPRIADIIVSILCMLLFAIPMLAAAIAIKLKDGGHVFYKQKRCTKNGKVFNILKFRSMIVNAETDGTVIPCVDNDSRITKVGKVIRRFRIDEMPQIFNVLRGDVSIVGPRPERIEHVQEYTRQLPEFAYRLRVNGGLTGYAQIYGKYNTSAEDKLKLDLIYIENQSLLLDLKLIMLTLKIIFIPESTEGFAEEKSKRIGKWENRDKWYEENEQAKIL